jgi:methyl-accepting chemotaxis protein
MSMSETSPAATSGVQMDPDVKRRIERIAEAMEQAASGHLSARVDVGGDDAVGRLGRSAERLFSELRGSTSAFSSSAATITRYGDAFGNYAKEVQSSSERTVAKAKTAGETSEKVSRNVQSVATATEEMAISVRDIAKNASEAARIATGAVEMSQENKATISKLGDSSTEIGKVIKVITSIAQQTNLLALNATIEAARAGEAGKGFAVVANEVKELAKETAKATEDISQKIEAIQKDTKSAVSAIEEISQVINQINDFQSSIASAVEEQTATTNEISRSIGEAAKGSQEVTENIAGLTSSAESIVRTAEEARGSVSEMTSTTKELSQLADRFKS